MLESILNIRRLLAVGLAISCFSLLTSAAETADVAKSQPSFSILPGRAVGVIIGNCRAARTRAGLVGPEDAVGFVSGGGDCRWVYVPSEEKSPDCESLVLSVGKDGRQRKRFPNVELLRQPQLKARGLNPEYQLVEVEVNGGEGSPATDTFVATATKVLDGTPYFPTRLAPAVEKLKGEFAALVRAKADDIEAAMAKERKAALGEEAPTGPRQERDDLAVTWRPDAEAVRIELTRTLSDGLYSKGEGTKLSGERGGKTGESKGRPFGITYGVQAKVVYQVKKTGDVSASGLKITPWRSVTPPPPSNKPPPEPRGDEAPVRP